MFFPDPKPTPKQKKPYLGIKRSIKATGQKTIFMEIWNERPHVSEVSGEYLGNEPNVSFFSHILGKKAYPRFILNKNNILLMTFEEHYEFDFGSPEGSMWDKVFELKEQLKIEYHLPRQTC